MKHDGPENCEIFPLIHAWFLIEGLPIICGIRISVIEVPLCYRNEKAEPENKDILWHIGQCCSFPDMGSPLCLLPVGMHKMQNETWYFHHENFMIIRFIFFKRYALIDLSNSAPDRQLILHRFCYGRNDETPLMPHTFISSIA